MSNPVLPESVIVPEIPAPVTVRRISEWADRADLAEMAYLDGKWRVLTSYPEWHIELLERWIADEGERYVHVQHCLRKTA